MKIFNTIKIECIIDLKISDIAQYIKNHFTYNESLFEIFNLDREKLRSKKMVGLYESLNLDRFAYSYILPHLRNPDYPEHSRYPGPKWHTISNLDDNWEYGNPTLHGNVSEDFFSGVMDFCSGLKNTQFKSFMVGFDKIEWAGEPVESGTYGDQKAKTAYYIGEGYLSNSLIITRTAIDKPNLIARLSCESKYRELECVKGLIAFLGKIKREKEVYAPSDEAEREFWTRTTSDTKKKIGEFEYARRELLSDLPTTVKQSDDPFAPYRDKINIRKLEREYLCFGGWETKSKDPHFRSTVTRKTIDGIEYKMWIDSLHGGHYLQLWFSCSSPMFELPVHSGYSANPIDEEQAVNFMKNAAFLREKFVEIMTN